MKLKLLTLAALSTSHGLYAAPNSTSADNSNYDSNLQEVVIVDTRSSKASTASISSTTRMNRQQIEDSGVRNVDQLLQQMAGIQFNRTGGPGSLTSFYIRGAEADSTLVLLNDVKIQSINTGFSAIVELPITSIESIEIIRGPQSTLYGSAAPGGIIKIYTLPEKQRNTMNVGLGASDQGDVQTNIGGTGKFDNFTVFGNAHWLDRNGIDSCRLSSACFTPAPETDLDGVEQINGQVGFQYFGDAGQSVQLSQLYNNARQEFDGSFTNESESTQKVTNLQWQQALTQQQRLRVDAGVFNEFYTAFLDAGGTQTIQDQYGTDRYSTSVVHEIDFITNSPNNVSLVSGVDYDNATLVDSNNFPEIERQTTGVFTEAQYQRDKATVRLGVRRDVYQESSADQTIDQTRYATTGHLKFMFDLGNNWALKTGIGRNFNMPNFADLYFPGASDPTLRPETHVSQDLGLEYKGDQYDMSAFLFRTESRDLIVFNSTTFVPENIGEALLQGLELMQGYRFDNVEFGADFTYLETSNETEGQPRIELPRRPKLQLSSHISYLMNKNKLRFGALAVGSRYDNTANTVEVGGYTIFNVGLVHQASDALTFGLRLENLTDKEYETVFGYNQPDRSLWFDMAYRIN